MQAGFRTDQVRIEGRYSDYARISDEADRKEHVFHFCPECGSQVFYTEPTEPDFVVVYVGSFADPTFPPPTESGYDSRRHPWIGLPESMRLLAPELWWDPVRPLYEAGEYAEAADKGLELIEARPDQPYLYYNVACCESLAGRTADAIEHLRYGDRDVGGLPGDGERGLGLRADPRRARVPGAARPLTPRSRVVRRARRHCMVYERLDLQAEGGSGMPKVVVTHAVADIERWLEGKAERAAAIESGSGSNVLDYVAQDGSNNIAVTADVEDLGALRAMLASPPPDVLATMEAHGVIPPITAYVAAD